MNDNIDIDSKKVKSNHKKSNSIIKHPSFNFKVAGVIMDDTTPHRRSPPVLINTNHPVTLKLNEPAATVITPAYVSELSKIFVTKIQELVKTRQIFSSNEYPDSFTGEEAIVSFYKLF